MNHDICLVVENSPYKTVRWILFLQNFSYIKFASQISSVSFSHKGEKQFFVWRTVLCRNSIEDWNLENYEEVFFFFSKIEQKIKTVCFWKNACFLFCGIFPKSNNFVFFKTTRFSRNVSQNTQKCFFEKTMFFFVQNFSRIWIFFYICSLWISSENLRNFFGKTR